MSNTRTGHEDEDTADSSVQSWAVCDDDTDACGVCASARQQQHVVAGRVTLVTRRGPPGGDGVLPCVLYPMPSAVLAVAIPWLSSDHGGLPPRPVLCRHQTGPRTPAVLLRPSLSPVVPCRPVVQRTRPCSECCVVLCAAWLRACVRVCVYLISAGFFNQPPLAVWSVGHRPHPCFCTRTRTRGSERQSAHHHKPSTCHTQTRATRVLPSCRPCLPCFTGTRQGGAARWPGQPGGSLTP